MSLAANETDNLHSIRDYLRWSVSMFNQHNVYFGHGTDNAWDEARLLILRSLFLPEDSADDVLDARLTTAERERLTQRIIRRAVDKVPSAYLLGEARFAGLWFEVNEDTLVPRSPLAELIETGFSAIGGLPEAPLVLDLCTGSGCIGIACAMHLQAEHVDLSDISPAALAVASRNIEHYGLEDSVHTIQSDVFEAFGDYQQYDLIVSNPPYVDADDLASMPAEYHHEPELGLAAGDDGLDLAHRILRGAARHLTANGWLVVEVGNSWEALEAIYPEVSFTWLEFAHGGHGVFAISAEQLREHFPA